MKKILYLLPALLMMLIGCNKEADSGSLTVSFETKMAVFAENVATISVVSNYKGDEPIEIPVDFSGSAIKGEDYELLAGDKFILGGAKPITDIDINFLKVGNNKELRAQLVIPENMKQGKYSTIIMESPVVSTFVSFETNNQKLFGKANIAIITLDGQGQYKRMARDTHIKVRVDRDKSTAIEGANFKIVNNDETEGSSKKETEIQEEYDVLIPYNQFKGYITLNTIGTREENKDKIVLSIDSDPTIGIGQYRLTQIGILTLDEVLPGKWKINELYPSKKKRIEDNKDYYDMTPDLDGYPELDKEDSFEIKDGKFIPNFKSELKNYFIGESTIVKAPDKYYPYNKVTHTYIYKLGNIPDVFRYILNNVNRNFSSKSQSEDKEAIVGIKVYDDTSLTLYIIDYYPTTFFLQAIKDFWWFDNTYEKRRNVKRATEKPVAPFEPEQIVLDCTRIEEQ